VVATYLRLVAQETAIAVADPADPRWTWLATGDSASDLGDDAADDDGDEIDDGASDDEASSIRARRHTRATSDGTIRSHLDKQSCEELVDLVCALTERFPDVREELCDRIAMSHGDANHLVVQARQELWRVTAEAGWQNGWSGEGHTPDFSRLQHRLERLVELGHHDAVVRLGGQLLERGTQQLGEAHDEGETATGLADCMPAVFTAVMGSSLPPPQQLLFAIDACLQDEYNIVGDAADVVFRGPFQPADWSAVADALAGRLETVPPDDADQFVRTYHRDRIGHWLVDALSKAGRDDEVPAAYETEARTTGSYERLVRFLIDQKRYDDAERWAREGIATTGKKLPGIASMLAQALCDIARLRRQWEPGGRTRSVGVHRPSNKGLVRTPR